MRSWVYVGTSQGVGETHNLRITVDLCGNISLPDIPGLPKFGSRHSELWLDALKGGIVQLLVELFKKLRIGIEAFKLSEL